jgi:hypothetical protein
MTHGHAMHVLRRFLFALHDEPKKGDDEGMDIPAIIFNSAQSAVDHSAPRTYFQAI